uniref:EB domain-containing protein n=1 Tax=Acrobeloides nanus TaxID=290746 RepID=A0A914C6N2_9BILA
MNQLFNGVSCTNDQTCQNRANGFFCYLGYCCSQTNPPPSGYGSSCTYTSQCLFPNSNCQNNICYCRAGYDYNGFQCVGGGIGSGVGVSLPPNGNCPTNQVLINGVCYNTEGYYDPCFYSQQCNFTGSVCLQQRCYCQEGTIYFAGQCLPNPDDQGTGANCPPNEVWVTNACYQMVGSGQNCIFNQQCILEPNLLCIGGLCTRTQNDQPTCGLNEVQINNQCYPIACVGQSCVYDEQCQDPYGTPLYCGNGICQYEFNNGNNGCNNCEICRNGATPETNGNGFKNCLYQSCSSGYQCEYNNNQAQYICCGYSGSNGNYGQIKMYLNTKLPLKCTAINSCLFVDYPNCAYSQLYGHNVCCSTKQCL